MTPAATALHENSKCTHPSRCLNQTSKYIPASVKHTAASIDQTTVIQLIGRRSTGDLETETTCLKYYQTAALLDDFNFDPVTHFHPWVAGEPAKIALAKKEKGPGAF